MNTQSSPRLFLTDPERMRLRSRGIKLRDISAIELRVLAAVLECFPDRAEKLRASALFQTIPSVGPAAADWLVDLGYRSLEDLRVESGPALLVRLERLYGHWMDPCLEDVLWCVVYHANHPGSDKVWYDFTQKRKDYRAQHGYPSSRPTLAWHSAP